MLAAICIGAEFIQYAVLSKSLSSSHFWVTGGEWVRGVYKLCVENVGGIPDVCCDEWDEVLFPTMRQEALLRKTGPVGLSISCFTENGSRFLT